MATTPVLLPGKSRKQRVLAGYSPWGVTEELDRKLWQAFSTGGGSEGVLGFSDPDCMLSPLLPPHLA